MLRGQRVPDFPVMAVRIGHASDSPSVALAYRPDFGCAGLDRAGKEGVGISDSQNYPNRATAKSFGTEILVLRRFVAEPEIRAIDRESCHHASATLQSIDFNRAKCRFVKLDGLGAFANRQPRRDRALNARAHRLMPWVARWMMTCVTTRTADSRMPTAMGLRLRHSVTTAKMKMASEITKAAIIHGIGRRSHAGKK